MRRNGDSFVRGGSAPVERAHMSPEPPTSTVSPTGTLSRSHRLVAVLTAFGERAGNALLYSSAYLAAIAMVEVALVMVLLGLQSNPAPLIVGLVTFAVYGYDRLADVEADATVNPGRAAFVRRHSDALYVLASISYATAVALAVLSGPMTFALVLLPGMLGVLYASDWIPDVGIDASRLKELLFVNTSVVALAWAVTLVFLPLSATGVTFGPRAAVVFAYFFLRMLVDTELSNVCDVAGDRETGVATVPVVFGLGRTRHVLYALDALSLALVAFAVVGGLLSLPLAAGLVVGLAYSLLLVSRIGRSDDEDRIALACEFESLVVAGAMLLLLL